MRKRNSLIAELKKLEGESFSKKAEFIWDYYKVQILIAVFLMISVVGTFLALSSSKEIVLSGYMFDSHYSTDHEEPFGGFADFAKLDTETSQTEFLTNLSLYGIYSETAQQLFSTIAAGQTDFVAASPETFLRLSYDSSKYFFDLREVLS